MSYHQFYVDLNPTVPAAPTTTPSTVADSLPPSIIPSNIADSLPPPSAIPSTIAASPPPSAIPSTEQTPASSRPNAYTPFQVETYIRCWIGKMSAYRNQRSTRQKSKMKKSIVVCQAITSTTASHWTEDDATIGHVIQHQTRHQCNRIWWWSPYLDVLHVRIGHGVFF
ncbi:unnamed protein product [Absidia cylindrospora]